MAAAKTNLVLVPGLLCTKALWAPQVEALGDIAEINIADHTRHDSMAAIARSILARGARAVRARGALHGRLHRLRDRAAGAAARHRSWRCSIRDRGRTRRSAPRRVAS